MIEKEQIWRRTEHDYSVSIDTTDPNIGVKYYAQGHGSIWREESLFLKEFEHVTMNNIRIGEYAVRKETGETFDGLIGRVKYIGKDGILMDSDDKGNQIMIQYTFVDNWKPCLPPIR